nr:7186_t:CDS:2 [Entrophospora candida]
MYDEYDFDDHNIRHPTRIQIYKEILKHLPDITPVALRIKLLEPIKIRKLFGKNEVANDISKLTNAQIQNIIGQVTSAKCIIRVSNIQETSNFKNRYSQTFLIQEEAIQR